MRPLFAVVPALASLVLAGACVPKAAPPPAPSDPASTEPLTEAERTQLAAPQTLTAILPEGPATRIHRIVGRGGLLGFWFPVPRGRADFVVHAMRRQLRLSTTPAPAKVDDAEAPPEPAGGVVQLPFVYRNGPDATPGSERIVVLAGPDAEADALLDEVPAIASVSASELVAFLARWREKTGVCVLSVETRGVELEVERLPPEENVFLSELAALTEAPDDDDLAVPKTISRLRADLAEHRRVVLP
jgi:hypothetical protein